MHRMVGKYVDMKHLGDAIRIQRLSKGDSEDVVGDAIGVTRETINRWGNGVMEIKKADYKLRALDYLDLPNEDARLRVLGVDAMYWAQRHAAEGR